MPSEVRGSASWGSDRSRRSRRAPPRAEPVEPDDDLGVSARALRARPHSARLGIAGRELVCGSRRARIRYADPALIVADGPESDLWLLVLDATRRPRPHAILPPGAPPARIEPNGLVRVLDRRVPLDTVLELARGLGVEPEAAAATVARVPPGRYGDVLVRHGEGGGYRVSAKGRGRRALERCDFAPLEGDERFVTAAEEGRLRRLLVERSMPVHHRLLWAASLGGQVRGKLVRRIAVEPHVRRTRPVAPSGGARRP